VDCYADFCCRDALRAQLGRLYRLGGVLQSRKVS
jgi:hypothetical protein